MRRAYDGQFVTVSKMERNHRQKHTVTKTLGIVLGSDATTEHECGIRAMKAKFGANFKAYGIDRLVCNEFPELLFREVDDFEGHKAVLLACTRYEPSMYDKFPMEELVRMFELHIYRGQNLFTAWDEESFGIMAIDDAIPQLMEVKQAFDDHDVCITMGRQFITSSGPIIVRKAFFSEELKKELLEKDKDAHRLEKAAEKLNLDKKLKDKGMRFFALSARWAKDIGHLSETKYDVAYWLNPYHQDIHNAGWYTVEELLLWADGKGPVINGRAAKK